MFSFTLQRSGRDEDANKHDVPFFHQLGQRFTRIPGLPYPTSALIASSKAACTAPRTQHVHRSLTWIGITRHPPKEHPSSLHEHHPSLSQSSQQRPSNAACRPTPSRTAAAPELPKDQRRAPLERRARRSMKLGALSPPKTRRNHLRAVRRWKRDDFQHLRSDSPRHGRPRHWWFHPTEAIPVVEVHPPGQFTRVSRSVTGVGCFCCKMSQSYL